MTEPSPKICTTDICIWNLNPPGHRFTTAHDYNAFLKWVVQTCPDPKHTNIWIIDYDENGNYIQEYIGEVDDLMVCPWEGKNELDPFWLW